MSYISQRDDKQCSLSGFSSILFSEVKHDQAGNVVCSRSPECQDSKHCTVVIDVDLDNPFDLYLPRSRNLQEDSMRVDGGYLCKPDQPSPPEGTGRDTRREGVEGNRKPQKIR